jgi:hypothetical protein
MKKNVLKIVLVTVFLLLFNVIYFMAEGTGRTASCWIAYGFIHASYLLLVFSGLIAGREGKTVELALPVYGISLTYFVINLLVGIVIIVVSPERIKLSLIVEILMLGIYLVFLCTTLLANEHTMEQTGQRRIEKRYVQDCSNEIKTMMERTGDRTIYKKLERVYDVLHASPLKSNDSVMEYELEVIRLIRVLDRNLQSREAEAIDRTIQEILQNAGERNRRLMG